MPVGDKSVIIYRLTSNQHDDYCKDFLSISIGRHVPEAYRRETAEGEIKRRDITTLKKLQRYTLGKRVGVSIKECDLKWSVLERIFARMAYFYARPAGVVVKVKLMRVVG